MRRRNSTRKKRAVSTGRYLVTLLISQQNAVNELPEAKILSGIQEQLAGEIISAMGGAEEIEELIELEMMYQKLDEHLAVSEADLNSIKNAQVEYLQVMDTIKLMRGNPLAYLASNRSARKTKRNLRIIDKSKALEQIEGNRTRLRNRTNFTASEWRGIWKSRIALATRTEEFYRALHNKLVDEHEHEFA